MNKKVLIIEDDSSLCEALEEKFKSSGFLVVSRQDGETGLKAAEEERPDIILLDLVLPRKNGFEVLETINQTEHLKHIPVVVLTNLESGADVERVFSLGGKAYLIKTNYELSEIVNKVRQVLS